MAQFLDKTGTAYLWSKIKVTFAPKASPTFTGTPTVPTVSTSDNSTKIASTEWVRNYVESLNGDEVNY